MTQHRPLQRVSLHAQRIMNQLPALKTLATGPILVGGIALMAASTLAMPVLFPSASALPKLQITHVFLDKKPTDTLGNFYFMLGTQMAARGQILAAEELLAKAVKLMPTFPDAFLNYGVVLEALDRNEEAIKAYKKAADIQAESGEGVNGQTLYTIGLLQDKMGNTDTGIATLKEALKIDPKNNLIAYDLGVLYSKKEDYQSAAQYSQLSLEGAQDFAEGYNNYGYALAHLGRYDDALKAINRSLELKPDSAPALDSKGFVYFGMKKYPEALGEYKKALALDPTIGEIYLHLAEVYEKMEDYPNATRAYEQYIQLTPRASNVESIRQRIQKLKQQDFAKKGPLPSPGLNIKEGEQTAAPTLSQEREPTFDNNK